MFYSAQRLDLFAWCACLLGAKILSTSDQVGLYLASIYQMAPSEHTCDKQACYSLFTYFTLSYFDVE